MRSERITPEYSYASLRNASRIAAMGGNAKEIAKIFPGIRTIRVASCACTTILTLMNLVVVLLEKETKEKVKARKETKEKVKICLLQLQILQLVIHGSKSVCLKKVRGSTVRPRKSKLVSN